MGAEADIFTAIRYGNLERVRDLLAAGADLEAGDSEHRDTPLGWSAFYGQPEIARFLLERGANVNYRDGHDTTPLGYALAGARGDLEKWDTGAARETYLALADLFRRHGGGE